MKPYQALFAALATTSIMALAGDGLAPLPDGWFIAGATPSHYKAGIDHSQTISGKGAKHIRSVGGDDKSWGTLMQMISADNYAGKRVRFQAHVKTHEVSKWAGLWMRVDNKSGGPLAFYNSMDKPIKGSTDWQLRSVVLDVPAGAGRVAFGVIDGGSGQVWIDDLRLEVVDNAVPLDAMPVRVATEPSL